MSDPNQFIGDSQAENGGNSEQRNTTYIFFNIVTVSLGFMQFGVGMNSWTNCNDAFAIYFGWTDNSGLWLDIMQSICIFGAAIGALSCSKFLAMGRYKLLLLLNLVLCIGVGISLIGYAVWVLAIGRFIWGTAFGAFSVVCAKMVNEIVPIELGGSFGAINQISLTLGACFPGTFALAYPTDLTGYPKDDFYISQYYRVIWSTALVIAFIQVTLLLTVFRNESPVFLKEKGRDDELLTVMKRYYSGEEVKRRLEALPSGNAEGSQAEGPTIIDTFFDKQIRKAAWVGFFLVTAQQLTGINSILFYSAQLFGGDDGGLTNAQASCVINYMNCLAAAGGAVMLNYFGRRTLLVWAQLVCVIGLFGMFIFDTFVENQTLVIILCIIMIIGFEFGPGPIVWLYLSEICNDKATSVNTVNNWFWTLVVSIMTPILNSNLNGYTWLLYGCTSTVGFCYYFFTVKETRGLSKEATKTLYNRSNATYNPIR